MPIEPIAKDENKVKSFRYKVFPKLLKSVTNLNESEIRWWSINNLDDRDNSNHSLMNYSHPYTYDNIDYIIWLIWWNSTYYYHDDKEKEVHLIELITNFPRMKLNRKLKPICVSSVWTTVFSNKKSTIENFKNLSYLFHHCKDILTNAEDKLKELNKYLISAKLLDLGFEYTTKQNDIRAKFQEKKDFKIESLAESLNDLSRSQENKEREKLIDSDNEHKSNEDNNKNKNFKLDLKEDYVSKSPDPNDYKRNIK